MEVSIDQVSEESSPETIENWDSLRNINLILALEEEFGIYFSDEQITEVLNVESIIQIIKNQIEG
jgi:acyl carrier protein